jgi:long-chain fatty acid transport protein
MIKAGSRFSALASGIAASAFLAGSAQAGGFINTSQSTVFNGMAYAGFAAPGSSSLATMFMNPATMTGFSRITTENNLMVIMPTTRIKGASGAIPALAGGTISSGDIGQDAIGPASYAVMPLGNNIWVGIAINSPFGLTTKPDLPWGGQLNSYTTKLRTYNFNPQIAYKFNDQFSVGLGFQAQYAEAKFISALGAGPTPPLGGLEGDGWGFGITAGLTFTPRAGTQIGLGYRSQMEQKLSGNFLFSPTAPGGLAAAHGTPVKGTLKLPDRVNLSLRQTINPNLDILASIEYQAWSRIGTSALTGPVLANPAFPLRSLPFEYKDGWMFALGGEYKVTPSLTWRAGIAYEISPVTTAVRSTRLPDNDRLWLSTGFSYDINNRFTLNASYSHVFVKNADIRILPGNPNFNGTNPYTGKANAYVDIFSIGLTTKWGAEPIPAGLPAQRKG